MVSGSPSAKVETLASYIVNSFPPTRDKVTSYEAVPRHEMARRHHTAPPPGEKTVAGQSALHVMCGTSYRLNGDLEEPTGLTHV